jgi:hypothetical protein
MLIDFSDSLPLTSYQIFRLMHICIIVIAGFYKIKTILLIQHDTFLVYDSRNKSSKFWPS